MPRQCLFCGSPLGAGRAQEHIFPKWLIEFMGIDALQLRSEHHVRPGMGRDYVRADVREAPPPARKEGRICRDCNNGWMSR